MRAFWKRDVEVCSPATGVVVRLEDVPDEAVSSGMLGTGIAVEPEDGLVVSPVKGSVGFVFPTRHALGLTTSSGIELLLHLGIDTVELGGKGFELLCKEGDKVRPGDPLVRMDLATIRAAKAVRAVTCVLLFPEKNELEPLASSGARVRAGADALVRVLG